MGDLFATKRDRLAFVVGVVAFVVIVLLMGIIRPEYYISEIKQSENSVALAKSEDRECRDFQLKLSSYAPNTPERINFIAGHPAKMGECFPAISRSRTAVEKRDIYTPGFFAEALRRAPNTAAFFETFENTKVAHDDLTFLEGIEKTFKDILVTFTQGRQYESAFLNGLFGLLCGLALWLSYRRNYKEFIVSSLAIFGAVACIYFDNYRLEWYSPYLNMGLIMMACYFLLFVKKWIYSGK